MTRLLWLGALLLLASVIACGDDDDGGGAPTTNGNNGPPAAGSASPQASNGGGDAPAPASSGSASGTLMVDGKTFEFRVIFCGLTPEETRNANVPFSFRGTGMDDGRSFSVDGSIVNTNIGLGTSTSHDLDIWYDDDPGNPIYNSGFPGAPDPEFVIDGKDVSFEAEFSNADGASVGSGSMQATCP